MTILKLSKTFSKEEFLENFKIIVTKKEIEEEIKEIFENACFFKINMYLPRNFIGIDLFDPSILPDKPKPNMLESFENLKRLFNNLFKVTDNDIKQIERSLSDYIFEKIVEYKLTTLELEFDNLLLRERYDYYLDIIVNDVLGKKKYYLEARGNFSPKYYHFRVTNYEEGFISERYLSSDIPFCRPRLYLTKETIDRFFHLISDIVEYMSVLFVTL